MRMNIQSLAGVCFGAALAIVLSVDVEAAPLNTSQAPAEISASAPPATPGHPVARVVKIWSA